MSFPLFYYSLELLLVRSTILFHGFYAVKRAPIIY